jgi:hypothetical protein
MAAPPRLDLTAPKRVPFDETIDDERGDYSAATFAMHIRQEAGDTGSALVALTNYAGTAGISATYEQIEDPNYPSGDVLIWVSRVRIRILEATLEALSLAADTSKALPLAYDLHVTPPGAPKFVMCQGAFLIPPGVTI